MDSRFTNILDLHSIENSLKGLSSNDKPDFGVMSPQQMVEHLIDAVDLSMNKLQPFDGIEQVDVERARKFLFSDREIRPGARAPYSSQPPEGGQYATLEDACASLIERLKDFHQFFNQTPDRKTQHPLFGPLNFQEWIIFHNKHFTHHFKQFRIFPAG